MGRLEIKTLGPLQATLDGKEVTGFDSDKVRALLIYLAVEGDQPQRREKLAGLLWPDWPERSARTNLRSALANLRQVIGDREADPSFLCISRQTIQFNQGSDYTLDTLEFNDLIEVDVGRLKSLYKAVGVYKGDFLEGFSIPDSVVFEEWILINRQAFQMKLSGTLARLAEIYEEQGNYEQALSHARRRLTIDPFLEDAHRQVMRVLAMSGQRNQALAQFESCREILKAELGVEPAGETGMLYLAIKEDREISPSGKGRDDAIAESQISAELVTLPKESGRSEDISQTGQISPGHLVGRTFELEQAGRLWKRTLARHGCVLFISGEAGIGKTRLVRELVKNSQKSGGHALVGACYADGGSPYAPFRQIIRDIFLGGRIALEENGFNIPDSVIADLVLLAPEIVSRYPDAQTRQQQDPQAEQQRLFESMTICFTIISDQVPLLIVLEDVQWADSGTLFSLRHLARNLRHQRIMIVATYRDVELDEARLLHETILDFTRERLSIQLPLSRLARDETEELLSILFAEEITDEFLDGIYSQTEGNPFFTEEVCKTLVESGRVYYRDGRWHRPENIEELEIPHSVRVAIRSRVQVLSTVSQEVLNLAAILGREFDFYTLAAAIDQDEDRLIEALEDADRAQLIEFIGEDDGGKYAFVHTLIPTTLVEIMRLLKRRQLHARAAEVIEKRRPNDYEALAFHYNRAGQEDKATEFYLQAGDKARELYAHQEAIENYQQALKFLEKSEQLEQAARTLMKLGLTYHNAFDFTEARRAYEQGFYLWQRKSEIKPVSPSIPALRPLRVTAIEPGSVNPHLAMDHPAAVLMDQLFSGLVEITPDSSVVPDVAKSWEVLEGGRKYIFHLREDVYWTDGVKLTAGDFEFAWKFSLDPARRWRPVILRYDIKGAKAYYEGEITDPNLVGVRALDDFTLSVDLEGPTSYFPYLLAFSTMFPIPKHTVQEHGPSWTDLEKFVTNGPFKLLSWDLGKSMTLERNPIYHGSFDGNLNRVECLFLTGEGALSLRMYENDDLDICTGLPLVEMDRARQRYAGDYVSGPWPSTDFIGFDVSRPPFDDQLVRRAFTLATDRETLAHVALRGYAFPATGGLVPPGIVGHSPAIGLPYDPLKARQLLSDAGYPEGRGFPAIDCLARDDPGHDRMCEYLSTLWLENLGVEVNWQQVQWRRFPKRLLDEKPHMWMVGWWADYPDPDDFLRIQWWVSPDWHHQAFKRLVKDAQQVMDQEERMSIYRRADQIMIETAPILPLAYGRFHILVKPWVKNYITSTLDWWSWKNVILEPH